MNRFFLIAILLIFILAMPVNGYSGIGIVDEVAFSINGSIVTKKQLEENIRIFKEFNLNKKTPSLSYKDIEKIVFNKIVQEYLLQQEAKKQNITVSSQEVQVSLESLSRGIPFDTFIHNLREKGIDIEELREKIKRELLAEKMMKWKAEKLQDEIKIEDTRVREFFNSLKEYIEGKGGEENKSVVQFYTIYQQQLNEEEKVWLAQIIVDSRKKAEEIIHKITKGQSFSNLATLFSLGPNAKKGGDLGWVNLPQIQPSLRVIITKLKEGEVTPPIKIDDTYYRILKLKARKQLIYQKWESKVRGYLFHREIVKRLDEWLKELKEESFIQIIDKDLEKEWKN